MIIAWFSCGVTSAVAIKIAIGMYGKENICPIYFKIDQVHPDNERFIKECEEWYGLKINRVQGKYKTPIEVALKTRYINGPTGARCTKELKKLIRQGLESWLPYDGQIFGFEYSKKELLRAERFSEQYPNAKPIYPLIEAKMTKAECLFFLERAGIQRPVQYTLGYQNNNCLGCFKGGQGYWNKIRIDYPEIFSATIKMERDIGNSCIKGIFLDELDPEAGRGLKEIMPDCGNFCEIEYLPSDLKVLNEPELSDYL